MDLALTLVIQGVVFFVVAWAVMKFIWPNILEMIEVRQKKIADGLAAASKSQQVKLPSETVLTFTLQAPVTVIKPPDTNSARPKLDDSH